MAGKWGEHGVELQVGDNIHQSYMFNWCSCEHGEMFVGVESPWKLLQNTRGGMWNFEESPETGSRGFGLSVSSPTLMQASWVECSTMSFPKIGACEISAENPSRVGYPSWTTFSTHNLQLRRIAIFVPRRQNMEILSRMHTQFDYHSCGVWRARDQTEWLAVQFPDVKSSL